MDPIVLGALIGAASDSFGNLLGSGSQSSANETNLRIARETNAFNAEQAQIQRDWSEEMWRKNNEYNSPQAMISRGLNPFLPQSSGAGISRSPASGASAAQAAGLPSVQAFKPDFSSVAAGIASFAQARNAISESDQRDSLTDALRDQILGNTNWRNIGIGQSGYWNAATGRRSASLDQSKEAQELENMRTAASLNTAQMTQVYLQADAQRVLNKYMGTQQQADLFIKVASLHNLEKTGILTEKQIETEIQRAILVAGEAKGQRISNDIAAKTSKDLIDAVNMDNIASYNERLWDSKNTNNSKMVDYSRRKSDAAAARYRAGTDRKDYNSYTLRKTLDYGLQLFHGIGNRIGTDNTPTLPPSRTTTRRWYDKKGNPVRSMSERYDYE